MKFYRQEDPKVIEYYESGKVKYKEWDSEGPGFYKIWYYESGKVKKEYCNDEIKCIEYYESGDPVIGDPVVES